MGKYPKKQKNTEKTKFILKGSKNTYYRDQLVISYTKPNINTTQKSQIPKYIKHSKFHYPAFYSPNHVQTTMKQAKYFAYNFKKATTSAPQNKQLYVYAPNSKQSNICNVCKTEYNNYFQHIKNSFHLNNIMSSPCSTQIYETFQKFKKIRQQQIRMASQPIKYYEQRSTEQQANMIEH